MTSSLILYSILTLLLFSALSPAAFLFRRSLAFSWLTALVGALVGWGLILFVGFNLPLSIPLLTWKPNEFFPISPALLVDQYSWPFALALATIALAMILTDVAREFEVELSSWAASLAIIAVGLVAVLAGNPLTLLLGWAALDITELLILLRRLHRMDEYRQAIAVFAARAGGMFIFLYGLVQASPQNIQLRFDQIPSNASIYLLLAASLRLGVVPLHAPFWDEPPIRRGIGTVSRLSTAAASLVLLPRVASIGIQESQATILLILTGLAALYAGFSWFNAAEELEGRPFWILGMAALSLIAAIRSLPLASLAWGITLIFSGGLLFLFSARNRFLLFLPIISVLSAAALPFTSSWYTTQIYTRPLSLWYLAPIFSHALLLGGFIRHSLRSGEELSRVERWVWLIYPGGLFMILLSQYLAGWLSGILLGGKGWAIGFATLLPATFVIGLALLWLLWARHGRRMPEWVGVFFRNVFSLIWFYNLLGWLFRLIGRAISFLTIVLEGEGGVLWALLLLVLLIAFLSHRGLAGG